MFISSNPSPDSFCDETTALSEAQSSLSALAAKRNNRWYPKFHIASQGGWINDPNGLCFYKGRWQVYYQLNPFAPRWGQIHWGHVSSADMVTWRREPVAFAPSLNEERDGVFSGSAVVGDDGLLYMYYTGNRWINGQDDRGGERQVQMMAVSEDDDATRFKKLGMIIDSPQDKVHDDFRDPKVWKQDGIWYLIHGVSSINRRGQIWLYTSKDMVRWNFDRILFEHPDINVFMLECPDFFPLTDPHGKCRWLLSFSAMGSQPQGFMNRNQVNAGYLLGDWRPGEPFHPTSSYHPWDWGHNYYAPQSFGSPDGRRIMYGWMNPMTAPIPTIEDSWSGQLTLPREVFIGADDTVRTKPVHEVESLHSNHREWKGLIVEGNREQVLCRDVEAAEITMTVNLAQTTSERCGLKVHATNDGSYTYVAYDKQLQSIVVDRQTSACGDRGYRAAPLPAEQLSTGILELRLFVDRGSIEVFINEGRQAMSSYSFSGPGPRSVNLLAESGSLNVDFLAIDRLGSINLDR